jgi:hypothetical protein
LRWNGEDWLFLYRMSDQPLTKDRSWSYQPLSHRGWGDRRERPECQYRPMSSWAMPRTTRCSVS